jgi:hypothetical protein
MAATGLRWSARHPAGIVIALVALALCGLAYGAGRYTASTAFCGGCHSMRRQFVTHERSAHQQARCVDCHTPPGCVACHDANQVDAGMARKGVNLPRAHLHASHIRNSAVACATCHARIMHARLDGSRPRVDRAVCGGCHDQAQAAGAMRY